MDEVPLSRILGALRQSATASPSTSPLLGGGVSINQGVDLGDDPGKDPRFRALVEAVRYSRRFVLSYNLVLLFILAIFTAWNWCDKSLLQKRRKSLEAAKDVPGRTPVLEAIDEAWSSSSSTVAGTITPSDGAPKALNEETPLLQSRKPKSPGIWKIYLVLKSWIQYQPRPVPIIHKTLPPNSTSLLVLAFISLNFFYNFYNMPMNMRYLFVFADRCGLIFSANLPILYLLAAKNQPIKFLTGHSYESLNVFHRRVGELLCFEALIHLIGMFLTWYGLLRKLGFTLERFIFNELVGLGLGTFAAYEILYLTSLGSFRQRCYEIFLALHIFLQIAGLILLWLHYHTSRPYVGVSLAIFLIDRLIFRIWLKSSTHAATLAVQDDDETIILSSNWDISKRSSALSINNMKNGWRPNEHIFISIPTLSKKHMIQSHPFTIFSAAPTDNTTSSTDTGPSHAWFSLLIRAQKDSGFTRTLLDYARTHQTTRIRLDGPYGSSHALDMLYSSNTAIIVAGGSGIAVAYPLLWALLNPPSDEQIGRPLRRRRKVRLLWIIHSALHKLWVPADKMQELQDWGLELLVPPPTSDAGRPVVTSIVGEWVDGARNGVVVSGPDGLVRDVRNTCAAMVRQGVDVNVQVEKFGW
ncbi:hypothetical protein EJ04DRAFT_588997 [Polyplosphaeria fusca]|uniref:FAD-binding FR-type domain-containing protein n=1 Tax=Polyplosphaeria fusca TaxID=682080 RepID=A0A9P4R7J1_9PLEO|nr:hypothetical protein EJ04DRAFT_588997 [Polyplosphaeria fusca]